jgi:RNA polymerase sigma factor (sigma-70 family)
MERYLGAVRRYLLGAVGDPTEADDLAQKFALRFVSGGFQGADPARGRFLDYLKTALWRLVTDYHRERQRQPRALTPDAPEPAAPEADEASSARNFLSSWREELLERTWSALAAASPAGHAVLRLRVECPELTSAQLAERLAGRLGNPVTAAWVRKTLQRAHDRYADLLLEEVAHSLAEVTPQALRQELEELDLLRYCRAALERWAP